MIALFTDFGHDGLYVGQMHAVIAAALPDARIIDLCHSLPPQNITSAAYLLPAYSRYLPPACVTICVVDPGVGSARPHALCEADSRWYIGPDNGLFDVLWQHSTHFRKYHFSWPGEVSNSFHGRDVYAPAACLLAESGTPDVLDCAVTSETKSNFPADLAEIIYFDHYGNAMSGMRRSSVADDSILLISGRELAEARTFSGVTEGRCFWYENANGLVEIAANRASARDILNLQLGSVIDIR